MRPWANPRDRHAVADRLPSLRAVDVWLLDDLGSGDVTSVLVTKTETTLEAVRRLHEHTAKMLQRLEENAVHLQKVQSAGDTGTPKPEETPKTAKKKDKKNKKVKPKKGKAKPPVAAV